MEMPDVITSLQMAEKGHQTIDYAQLRDLVAVEHEVIIATVQLKKVMMEATEATLDEGAMQSKITAQQEKDTTTRLGPIAHPSLTG